MTKFRWNESMNMFRDHVDPEKEDQLKWITIDTDTKVKRITRLVKVLNAGNREAVQKKKSEVVYLIEDIHKQYQVLYTLYEDLRELVKRKCINEEDKEDCESSSSSLSYSLSMESAGFFSPSSGSKTPSHHDLHHHDPHHHDPHHHYPHHHDQPKVAITDEQSVKSEHSPFSLEDTSEVVKEALSIESVSTSYDKAEEREEDGRTVEKLVKETEYLRDRLEEKEKKYQKLETKSSAKLKVLEDRIIALNIELEAVNHQKDEQENEQFDSRNDEIQETSMENSDFQSLVSELELAFKDKESEVLKKMDNCEKIFKDKIDKYMDRLHNLQREVGYLQTQNEARKKNSYEKEKELESLRFQNQQSQMELQKKTKEAADSHELLESLTEKLNQKTTNEKGLVEERNSLQKRIEESEAMIASIHNEARLSKEENEKQKTAISQLEEKLQLKEGQIASIHNEARLLKQENEKRKTTISKLEEKLQLKEGQIASIHNEAHLSKQENEKQRTTIYQLEAKLQLKEGQLASIYNEARLSKQENEKQKTTISQLEEKLASIHNEARLSKQENEKQKATISQLEEKLQKKEGQIVTLESKFDGIKKDLSTKMKTLEQKFKSSELDKRELKGKNEVLAATLEQKEMLVNKLNQTTKTTFHMSVKKMGEMVDEFRKKSEDSIRILSQRIRVAEQLHNETRDWYKKTKDKCAQDRQDTELALRSIKLVMASVSDTLSGSETLGLRFVDCCEDFMNRVSKVSCEINFVKDWVRRKNTAMVGIKEDVENLTVQLDNKEEENLKLRENVLKLENRVRELEKTVRELEKVVKENNETMIGLKEEKREAIRQLCVWIDYHRSRSEYLQRSIAELLTRNQSQRMT